ncbi:hypothetical protein ACWERV_36785, partial [Streptomyces sp. NPDC004031]
MIGSIGDYHTARLNDAQRRLVQANVEFRVLVMNRKSSDYLHRDAGHSGCDAPRRPLQVLLRGPVGQ